MEKKTIKGKITEEQLFSLIDKEEIEYVSVCIPMTTNVFYKRFEATFFLKNVLNGGMKMPELSTQFNYDNIPQDTKKVNMAVTNDLDVTIDKTSFRRMAWLGKEHAVCIGSLFDLKGKPYLSYPRNILLKTLKNARDIHGFSFKHAPELEYYILKTPNPQITENSLEINLEKHQMTTRFSDFCIGVVMDRYESFNKQTKDNIKNSGIELEALFTEHGPAQHEVNIRYGDVIENCDNHIFLKQCIKHTAYTNGLGCSFMAKTFINTDGSSAHVHLSAYTSGKNIFFPSSDESENYTIDVNEDIKIKCHMNMIYFIGGILKHIEELFLIYAPNINSYKRFKKNSFAPVYINTWSYDSRTSTVRIVGSGESLHLEIRLAGSDVNPYLLLSAIIASGVDGIVKKITPPEMEKGNTYDHEGDQYRPAPLNLHKAAKLFAKSEFATEIFGDDYKEYLVTMANNEWADFMNHITAYEVNKYIDMV